MRDFLVLPVSHPFLMMDVEVIKQTIQFLKNGCFVHEGQGESSVAAQSKRSTRAHCLRAF
jgi:hypothetical protein